MSADINPGPATLVRPDATLTYWRAGHCGPKVLLIQGVGCRGEGWRAQVDALAGDHSLVWFDNRGIGRSTISAQSGPLSVPQMAADGLALIDHLGWQTAHLVGHSMGGMITQEIAALAPSRIQSLSLLSTAHRGRDVIAPPVRALWHASLMHFGTEKRRWGHFAALAFPPAYLRRIGIPQAIYQLRSCFIADFIGMPSIVRRQLAALWRHRGADLSALTSTPVLIATGNRDLSVKTRLSDQLHALLPNSRIERFADAAHAITLQHAQAIALLLREHIARADDPTAQDPVHT